MDLLSYCQPGACLKTRDRREARILAASTAHGLISGEVQMHGPCVWLLDGRWRDAPFGATGPLDLVPPARDAERLTGQPAASVRDALAEDNRTFCCD